MKFREKILDSGKKLILGKDEKTNDELMEIYRGKENIILHTHAPGSPFGVLEELKPTKEEIYSAATWVSFYSQDWRDNKKDVEVDVFTGKDIEKRKGMKAGTWGVKKAKRIKVKKEDIGK